MKNDEKDLIGKSLMKRVMLTWARVATALLEMMIFHLRSPYTAQRYSVKNLFAFDKVRFFAFGCVFAGEVATGAKVRIMGPNYVPGGKRDLYSRELLSGWGGQESEDVSFGNTVSLAVLDQFITKNETLTNKTEVDAHPIRAMKFSVSLVVRVASDLPCPS
ncbi:hypothetical protein MKX03_013806 [Papaver bracteatum]|nr:hypothetical protein MKX03_013806 [Papaver bracteatum]